MFEVCLLSPSAIFSIYESDAEYCEKVDDSGKFLIMGVPDCDSVKLYVRFPVKITDEEQVRALHPSIVSVTLPRQKARWCFVQVDTTKTKRGIKDLKALKVDGKKVYISEPRTKKSNKLVLQ